jgi:hypothetical protein
MASMVGNPLHSELSGSAAADTVQAERLAQGRETLTEREQANLRYAYNMFDDDRSGDLSQGEIIKLLQRLGVVGNKDDAIKMMRQMDQNNDGSVDINEFVAFFDREFLKLNTMSHPDLKEKLSRKIKLGYAGTSWRAHANIAWMSNAGIVLIAVGVGMQAIIYFRFVLVPLTMAYFMTFLIGPLMDFFYQRPLIFRSNVLCELDHYSKEEARKMWDRESNVGQQHGSDVQKMPEELPETPLGEPDYDHIGYPIKSRQCNPVPWRENEYPIKSWRHCQPCQVIFDWRDLCDGL